ncbi:hypothetical protein ACR9VJ_18110 [Streptomyces sp. H49]|uniref:hypothetical protein n=1 Tax=Streptomyces sp. H49 TaxID=3444117 RepID=UPI003F4A9B11
MTRVTMRHPDLEQQIEVPEASVPHYRASGWQVADAPTEPKKTARRRRQTGDDS